MRITVDISNDVLKDLSEITGEDKKSRAVAFAVGEFVRTARVTEFANLFKSGDLDYPATNDEIEKLQG